MDEIKELLAGIVIKAVDDWQDCVKDEIEKLTKGDEYESMLDAGVSYAELRRFFLSDYGAGICETLSYDSEAILTRLENERAFALQRAASVPA